MESIRRGKASGLLRLSNKSETITVRIGSHIQPKLCIHVTVGTVSLVMAGPSALTTAPSGTHYQTATCTFSALMLYNALLREGAATLE